jgi:hypothetical protein
MAASTSGILASLVKIHCPFSYKNHNSNNKNEGIMKKQMVNETKIKN